MDTSVGIKFKHCTNQLKFLYMVRKDLDDKIKYEELKAKNLGNLLEATEQLNNCLAKEVE